MKKVVKTLSIVIAIVVIALFTVPFLFKEQIENTIQNELNKRINAELSFEKVSLNLWQHFPKASINISDLLITNENSFENDTLLSIENIQLTTTLTALLNTPKIDYFSISNGFINLETTINGEFNFDILKAESSTSVSEDNTNSSDFSFHIEQYDLKNIHFNYADKQNKISATLKEFNHSGTGKFSNEHVQLTTKTSIQSISVIQNSIPYLNKAKFLWQAELLYNLENQKISFDKNSAQLNDLKFYFDGFVQPANEGIAMVLQFDVLESKFKSLLSLIPDAYAQSFDKVTANGALDFKGTFNGLYSDSEIPKFDIFISSKDASFKYPELPKTMEHITFDTHIGNETGAIDDTEIQLNKLSFQIDKDVFSASGTFRKLMSNPTISAKIDGKLNLDNLSETYPIPLDQQLHGIVDAHIKTAFSQKDIDTNNFEAIKNEGNISVLNMTVISEMFPNPFSIETAHIEFTPKKLLVKKCQAKTGKSDLSVTGNVNNLIGFAFGNKVLSGTFDIKADRIITEDFLSETASDTLTISNSNTTAPLKIPTGIAISSQFSAKNVHYDNLILKNCKGALTIKDQTAQFKKINAKLFDGAIHFDGMVNTKETPSTFDLGIKFESINIEKAFSSLELFSSIAPFAKTIDGTMSSSFDMKGNLDHDLMPTANSISGKTVSNMEVSQIDASRSKTMSLLDKNLDFIDFAKLDIKKINAKASIENGMVRFSPFKIASYDAIPIQMSGTHSFDNDMNYQLLAEVPATFFGKETEKLLSGLSEAERNDIHVPLKVTIGGTISKPNVTPDYKSAISSLTSKIAKSQTNKFIDRILKTSSKEKDSTKTNTSDDIKKAASKLLKKLF